MMVIQRTESTKTLTMHTTLKANDPQCLFETILKSTKHYIAQISSQCKRYCKQPSRVIMNMLI